MEPAALRSLRDKYETMRAMRADTDALDPTPAMRALARRFPGALREIDELPLEAIDARIASLEDALERGAPAPAWARPTWEYHGWMRAALVLKRRFGRARDRDGALEWLRCGYLRGPGEPDADALAQCIDEVLRPPGGRLNRWLFARLAANEGVDVAALEALVFPPSPRRARFR